MNPTKAVSATRNTLNGSTKNCSLSKPASIARTTLDGSTMNCSSSQTIGPPATTRAVRSVVAKKVAKLIVAFSSGAQSRWPVSASSSAPRSGRPRTMAISMKLCRRPRGSGDPVTFGQRRWIPAYAGMTVHRSRDSVHQSSFSFSMCRMSRLSKRSRMWKKKMPKMNVPTSTSRATPSSTTSGIP